MGGKIIIFGGTLKLTFENVTKCSRQVRRSNELSDRGKLF
jgi:hypothetical protein